MVAINFPSALTRVLRSEGGYVDNPHDPGGATNLGVTQRVFDAWRRSRGQAVAGVRALTSEEAGLIYRAQYWAAVRGDDLLAGLDYCLFDEGVNSGPGVSVKDLQTALGLRPDGHLGLVTLGAVAATKDLVALVNRICDLRLSWLHRLRTWRWFGTGWRSRVEFVRVGALAMARGTL